jgi:hypothetical protein
MEMYKAIALVFAVLMAVATPAFSQQEPAPNQKLATAVFEIVKDVRLKQLTYCKNPRSYAVPVCNMEFEFARKELVEMLGWQILLNLALSESDKDLTAYLQERQATNRVEAVEAQRSIETNFYPLP